MEAKFEKLNLEGLLLITPQVFEDERGFFLERFRDEWFEKQGIDVKFVQDNHSKSCKGVLRGLHYSIAPHSQGKLVWVAYGEIFDVAVDLRQNSPSFGRWESAILSADNKKMLFMPAGFAHGFQTLSETADVLYKISDYYYQEFDKGIRWNDPDIAIAWPIDKPIVSEKDKTHPVLKDAKDLF